MSCCHNAWKFLIPLTLLISSLLMAIDPDESISININPVEPMSLDWGLSKIPISVPLIPMLGAFSCHLLSWSIGAIRIFGWIDRLILSRL